MQKALLRSFVVGATVAATAVMPIAGHGLTAQAASAVVGPLKVQGNQIVDGNGNPLTLRGIQRELTEMSGYGTTSNPAVTQAEIAAMKAWGANAVRIPVNSALWTNVCPVQHDANYQTNIDNLVHLVNGQGMVAIVDLHVTTGNLCGSQYRHAAPDSGAVEFWKEAAAHYANWPLVVFELFNEPHVSDPSVWLTGSTTPIRDCDLTDNNLCAVYQPVGEKQLYDAAESTPARNLVIIDADGWASNPSAVTSGYAVNDYNHNIVYAVHPYTCSQPSVTTCMSDPASHQANTITLDKFQAVAKSYPVMATEFGWPNPPDTGTDFYASTYAYLDSQTPAWGSIAFAWNGTLTGGFHMLASLAPNYAPNATGQAVKTELSNQP